MRTSVVLAALVGLAACGPSGTEGTKRELHQRLQGQNAILGCPRSCPANRVCGTEAIDRLSGAVSSKRAVIVEAVNSGGMVRDTSFYFVDSDGSGTEYFERLSDTKCEDCGWYERPFQRIALRMETTTVGLMGEIGPSGRITLTTDGQTSTYSVSLSDCD